MFNRKLSASLGVLLAATAGGVIAQDECVLEIAEGAVITGASAEDFLIIEQDCRIDARGTAEMPINFTAAAAVEGGVEGNARGLWGGLVINGNAPINDCPEGATGGSVGDGLAPPSVCASELYRREMAEVDQLLAELV